MSRKPACHDERSERPLHFRAAGKFLGPSLRSDDVAYLIALPAAPIFLLGNRLSSSFIASFVPIFSTIVSKLSFHVRQDSAYPFRGHWWRRHERDCRGIAESWIPDFRLRPEKFDGDAAACRLGRNHLRRPCRR